MPANRVLLLVVGLCLPLNACVYPHTHKASKPDSSREDFPTQNVHQGQLPSEMRSMMQSVATLMSLETDASVTESQRQARVLRELRMLENAVRVTGAGDEISSRTEVNPYMNSLLHDIQMAREFAVLDPPDYQPSSKLIRGCVLCHQQFKAVH